MFKYNPSSLTSKAAMALAGVLFMSSTIGAIAAPQFPFDPPDPECFGDWRITGTTYDGNPVDVTRLGYVYDRGREIHWEGHTALGNYETQGLDGRTARWDDLNGDRCPDEVLVYNSYPHPDELFQVNCE